VIAANLPDADLVYSGLGGSHLRYMLQHRGYTHTVLFAIVGAVAAYGVSTLVWRSRDREAPTQEDAHWLLGLLLVSTLSHLVLDWTNSYGVHPFWPVDNRWYYGDAVFIIEPWLWVVSVPILVRATGNGVARVVLSLVMLAGLALAWRMDFVSRGAAAALTLAAVLFVVLALVLRAGPRVVTALAGWIAITLIFAAGSAEARVTMRRAVHEANPEAEMLDIVVSPLPANPACASVISVERLGVSYHVATARVSAVPTLVTASSCGARQGASAMLTPPGRRSTMAVHWDGDWTAPSAELATLVRASCPALAAMRFIRVPIWHAIADSSVVLGDVRFGGGAGSSFTDVEVPQWSEECRLAVPPWTPPRADLLGL
jgi:inner membrane protein